jgi:predicted  nucleic acid-binding Zn-ribbon protein
MNTPLADIIDRYTILLLKSERAPSEEVNKELEIYEEEARKVSRDISKFVTELYSINSKIWDLEADIRKGKEKVLGLEEVGRRAILIRDYNKKRVALKNEITQVFGDGFLEVKNDHASE